MTEREEKAGVTIAALGLLLVLGGLAWALPGPVALITTGIVLVLLGVGWNASWDALAHGVAGVQDATKERMEEDSK